MSSWRPKLAHWGGGGATAGSTTHRLGFFRRCQDFRKILRVVEDDTKTEDAIPYWKIDDFLRFPGFSWIWVVFRAPREKKVETKRFYLQRSASIQPKTSEMLPKFCQKLATTLRVHYPTVLRRLLRRRAFRSRKKRWSRSVAAVTSAVFLGPVDTWEGGMIFTGSFKA